MKVFKESMRNVFLLIWQDFINLFNLSLFKKRDKKALDLRKDGIVMIENFLDETTCDQLSEQLKNIVSQHDQSMKLSNGSYLNFRNQDNPGGTDHGMIDIFDINKSIPEVDQIDDQEVIALLKSATNQNVYSFRRNAYVNDSVTGTRGYHIDNIQPVLYKAFIYLTDVTNVKYGPYSFVCSTHKFSPSVYFNLIRNAFFAKKNSTDMLHVNDSKVLTALAKKGTLILSNQNAVHRGLPQHPGEKRIALVLSYLVKSRFSYVPKKIRSKLVEHSK